MPEPEQADAAGGALTNRSSGAVGLDAVRVDVLASADAAVLAAECELDAAAFAIPLPSRVAWARAVGGAANHTAIARTSDGTCLALVGVSVTRTRALPWHRVVRVEAFGEQYATPAGLALLRAVADFSRRRPAILRAVVELECRDESSREVLRTHLRDAGFAPAAAERVSERTLAIDLLHTDEEIFSSFGRSTRQNIRGAAKHGLELAPVDDPRCGERMNALLADSLARTGAPAQHMDWGAIVQLCRDLPHRSRVIGVFRGASRAPADLVGFAWGLHHGERVEYHTGASDRIPGVRLPILYPAIWDLVTWGRRSGGRWFDMGGVTQGTLGSSDALGGISDFKRGFTKDEISLGEEWAYEPHAVRARVAAWTSHLARTLRQKARARGTQRAAPAAPPPSPPGDESPPSRPARAD